MQITIAAEACRKMYRLLSHKTSTELRFISPERRAPPISKFVTCEDQFLTEAKNPANYSGISRQVYVGLHDRKPGQGTTAGIVGLGAILLDIDRTAERKNKNRCATDEEVSVAIQLGKVVAHKLYDEFGIRPTVAMSGNGCHVLIRASGTSVTDENRDHIAEKIKTFGDQICGRFNPDFQLQGFELDSKVFDLARITKLIGTMSVKGDNHRMTYFVDGPYPPSHADQLFANYLMSLPVEATKASRTKSRKTTPTSIPEIPQATSDHVEHLLEKCAFIKQFETKPLENYDKWIGIGGNLRLLGDAGLTLWDRLSSGASNYSAADLVDKWEHGDLYAYGCHRLGCTQRCGVGMPINHVYERFGTGGDTNDLLKVTVPLRTIRDDLEHHIKKILNGA
ncbi:MAG: hypothetical protein M0R49_02965 [Limnochordia bacterium]|nr:hypothetical protein [Limnochordia bacterium]